MSIHMLKYKKKCNSHYYPIIPLLIFSDPTINQKYIPNFCFIVKYKLKCKKKQEHLNDNDTNFH